MVKSWGSIGEAKIRTQGREMFSGWQGPPAPDLLWFNLFTEDRLVAPFLTNLSVSPVWPQLLTTGSWATSLLGLAETQTLIPPARGKENMHGPAGPSPGTELRLSNVEGVKCPRVLLINVSEMYLGVRKELAFIQDD